VYCILVCFCMFFGLRSEINLDVDEDNDDDDDDDL